MKPQIIGIFHDECLGEDYSLYQASLGELRKIVSNTLKNQGINDVTIFDTDNYRWQEYERKHMNPDVESTYITNGFISLQGGINEDPWLLDGYTRLFKLEINVPVFVKVYSKDMPVSKVIKLLFQLNYWKTNGSGHSNNRMIDRGFTLYTYMRTGINMAESRDNDPMLGHGTGTFIGIIKQYIGALKPTAQGNANLSANLGAIAHDNFFDDVVLLHKMHSIQFEARKQPHNNIGDEMILKYLPIYFYEVIARQRAIMINTEHNSNIEVVVEHMREWLCNDKFIMKKFHEYFTKINSNGQITCKSDITEYFNNKYFKPVVLGTTGELTELEKKKAYKKDFADVKKAYKKISTAELIGLDKGTVMYTLHAHFPNAIRITEYKWLGVKEKKYMAQQQTGINRKDVERTEIEYWLGIEDREISHNYYTINDNYTFFIKK